MPTAADYSHRISTLQSFIPTKTAILIAKPTDIWYLTGFEILVPDEREALLLVARDSCHLLHASFSPVTAIPEVKYYLGCTPPRIKLHFEEILSSHKFTTLELDAAHLFLEEYYIIKQFAVTLSTIKHKRVTQQRTIKDSAEKKLLTKAGSIAAEAWKKCVPLLEEGLTEHQVAKKIECLMLEQGADGTAFPTIVAFGANGALPHHQPSSQRLVKETPILVDFGARYQGYRSDMTRSLWFGDSPSAAFTSVETAIHQAYEAATHLLEQSELPSALEVDTAARSVISKAGYDKAFIHTTGHGVGLEIHEAPSLNWKNQTQLKHGMAVTIEPGIYLEGLFGYRYENTVLLDESGPIAVTATE